jgi:hypothetical protein
MWREKWTSRQYDFWNYFRTRIDDDKNWNGSGLDPRLFEVIQQDGRFVIVRGEQCV